MKLTISADEALAETHTKAQEEDHGHTAHREEDNHGWSHCGTQTHTLKFKPKFRRTMCQCKTSGLNMLDDVV